MNAVKLARALRLAAEALEEDQGTPVERPKPALRPKPRARRLPESPTEPVSELAAESARRALSAAGFVRR